MEKLRAYVDVAGYRPPSQEGQAHRPSLGWQRRYPTFPHILFVPGDMTHRKAQARIHQLISNVTFDPFLTEHANVIAVWSTTLHHLQASDPFTTDFITQIAHGERRRLHGRRRSASASPDGHFEKSSSPRRLRPGWVRGAKGLRFRA